MDPEINIKELEQIQMEEEIRASYPHLSIQEIEEMDESEKKMLLGHDDGY